MPVSSPPVPAGMTILVADDDDELRGLVVHMLRSDGYRVLEARDGAEMLALIEASTSDPAERPDLVILDVQMPELSGFGVLKELRRMHVGLPVLVMSGFDPASVSTVAHRLGASGVLRKPFNEAQLRGAIANVQRAGITGSR